MSDGALLETLKQGDVTVVVLGGEYENYVQESFEQFTVALLEIVQTAEPLLLLLDISQVVLLSARRCWGCCFAAGIG